MFLRLKSRCYFGRTHKTICKILLSAKYLILHYYGPFCFHLILSAKAWNNRLTFSFFEEISNFAFQFRKSLMSIFSYNTAQRDPIWLHQAALIMIVIRTGRSRSGIGVITRCCCFRMAGISVMASTPVPQFAQARSWSCPAGMPDSYLNSIARVTASAALCCPAEPFTGSGFSSL